MFLRHEGFLGAVGAFLTVHPMAPAAVPGAQQGAREPRKVIICQHQLILYQNGIFYGFMLFFVVATNINKITK